MPSPALPADVRAADDARRQSIFALLSLGMTATLGGFLLINGAEMRPGVVALIGVGMGLLVANVVLHSRGAPLALSANLLVGIVYVTLASISLMTGGVGVAAPAGLAVVPMLAILLVSLRASLLWTLAVLAIPTSLTLLYAADVAFPLTPDPATQHRRLMVALVGIAGLMGLFALAFDWQKRGILNDLARAHEAMDAARAEAQAANETKTRFLANMSHEIRTPMNGVLNMLDVLGDGDLEADQQRSVAVAHRSAQALLHLLNDIVDLAKVESGALELEQRPFSLERTIREVVEFFSVSAGNKGITLEFVLDPDAPDGVVGDGFRLRQVLINLVGNAVKFTGEGAVTVSLLVPEAPPPLPAGRDAWLILAVADTGIGIEPDHIERIFDPFTQADASSTRRHGGTGLGLSISRQLIESMGGRLVAESVPGEGSIFRATLPVVTAEHVPEPEAEAHGRQTFEGARVLIVEDNPINGMVTRKLLEHAEIHCEEAGDGRAGVEMTLDGDFDLVLMDCQMPVMDGYDATRALRASGFNRPIVALTANAMEGDREKCLAAGMDDFLAKPLRRGALLAALHRWLPPTPIVERAPADLPGPPSGVFLRPGFLKTYTTSSPMAVSPDAALIELPVQRGDGDEAGDGSN